MYLMEARSCRESHGKLKGHINKLVRHVGFIKKNFGRNDVIVFDSYPDRQKTSTIDQMHMKPAKTSCPVTDFNEDMD